MKIKLLQTCSILCLLLVTSIQLAQAQLPHLGLRRATPSNYGESLKSLPATNPWVVAGAQLGYKFGGNDDFADGLVASGRVQFNTLKFNKQSPALSLPLIGNISKLTTNVLNTNPDKVISELVSTSQGLNFGLYPCLALSPTNASTQFTLYGSGAYKLNSGRSLTDSSLVYLHQGRFSFGLGMDVFLADNQKLPLSLSVEPVVTVVQRKDYQSVTGIAKQNIFSLELTGVLPIASNTGILAQTAIADGGPTLWRLGIIFVAGERPPVTPPQGKGDDADTTTGTLGEEPTPVAKPAPVAEQQYAAASIEGVFTRNGKRAGEETLTFSPYLNSGIETCGGTQAKNVNATATTKADGSFNVIIRLKTDEYANYKGVSCVRIINSKGKEVGYKIVEFEQYTLKQTPKKTSPVQIAE